MAFWEDKSRVVAKRLPTFRLPRRSGGRKRGYRPASFLVALRFKCVRTRIAESMVAKLVVGSGKGNTMDKAGLKQKAIHELREYLTVLLFLAPLFVAFSTYRMLLQGRFREGSFEYGTALINALILSKIILIGEYLRVGKRQENRPLIYSTVYKSFVFTLLVAVFHVCSGRRDRRMLHGEYDGRVCGAARQGYSGTAGSRPSLLLRLPCPFSACGKYAGYWAKPDWQTCSSGPVHPPASISLYCGDENHRCRLLFIRGFGLGGLPTRRHGCEDLCVWKSVSRP